MAERHGDLQALVVIECDLAQLECDGGHPERARDRLTTFLAGASRGAATENAAWGMPVWSQLAEAHLALGEVEEAERIAAHGAEQALAAREQLRYVPALIAGGAALGRRGCWDEAATCLEESTRLAHAMPYPLLEARALQARGSVASRQGDPQVAGRYLQSALAIARRIGARILAGQIEVVLRHLS